MFELDEVVPVLERTPAILDSWLGGLVVGPVTLGELLAAWVVHDLDHIDQVARVMARRYRNAVGPWVPYLPILGSV